MNSSLTAIEPTVPVEPPRPSRLMVVFSIVMLALCLGGAGSALALLLARGDDYAYISGAVLGCWSVWLGQLQFRSAFRRSLRAAAVYRSSLWLSAAFMAYLLIGWAVNGRSNSMLAGVIAA